MTKRHPGRPKNNRTEWPNCKVDECGKTTENGSRGFCRAHYMAARRGTLDMETGVRLRAPQRVSSYGPGALCLVEGCERKSRAKGMCSAHWQRSRKNQYLSIPVSAENRGRPASTVLCCVESCENRANNRGMCAAHAAHRKNGILDEQGNKLRELKKGGRPRMERRIHDGYVLVIAPPNCPVARADGSIFEHRLVMSQHLGRWLEDWELVHHRKGIRDDNRIEELELLDGRAKKGRGHPPGHELCPLTAIQVLSQQQDLPSNLRLLLTQYKEVRLADSI